MQQSTPESIVRSERLPNKKWSLSLTFDRLTISATAELGSFAILQNSTDAWAFQVTRPDCVSRPGRMTQITMLVHLGWCYRQLSWNPWPALLIFPRAVIQFHLFCLAQCFESDYFSTLELTVHKDNQQDKRYVMTMHLSVDFAIYQILGSKLPETFLSSALDRSPLRSISCKYCDSFCVNSAQSMEKLQPYIQTVTASNNNFVHRHITICNCNLYSYNKTSIWWRVRCWRVLHNAARSVNFKA